MKHKPCDCDGNCNYGTAIWKIIMNKSFRKNYRQRKMYLCSGCIIDLLDGVWSGGGPNGGNVKKIIKIKRKKQIGEKQNAKCK